jgi:hypothetical protein
MLHSTISWKGHGKGDCTTFINEYMRDVLLNTTYLIRRGVSGSGKLKMHDKSM